MLTFYPPLLVYTAQAAGKIFKEQGLGAGSMIFVSCNRSKAVRCSVTDLSTDGVSIGYACECSAKAGCI